MGNQIIRGSEQDACEIHTRLQAYNASYITDCDEFCFCVRSVEGTLLGGIAASRDLDCVTVDYLFVAEQDRRKGLGAELLNRVEEEGRRQGAKRVILNTFSFQAPEFYEKRGYRCFGGVEPALGEYGQYFYIKEL